MSLPDWMQVVMSRSGGTQVISPQYISGFSACFISGICVDTTISGQTGAFTSSITVQGKVVIKDGDPVAVASGEIHVISGVIQVTSGTTLPVSIVSGAVTVSGFVGALSGGTLPITILSGSVAALSGLMVLISGQPNPATSGGVLPISIVSGLVAPTTTTVAAGAISAIASGGAILYAVIPAIVSGTQPTFSGQSLVVNNATSGMVGVLSGMTLYNFSFLAQSGSLGNFPVGLTAIDAMCLSGISAIASSGVKLTIMWAKV